jgi:hypothetical protein
MLQLQSNVPPPRRRPVIDRRKKYPFESMQVGHFFFVPGKTRNSIRTYFSTAGKQHGIQLTSKLIHARQIDGAWHRRMAKKLLRNDLIPTPAPRSASVSGASPRVRRA